MSTVLSQKIYQGVLAYTDTDTPVGETANQLVNLIKDPVTKDQGPFLISSLPRNEKKKKEKEEKRKAPNFPVKICHVMANHSIATLMVVLL